MENKKLLNIKKEDLVRIQTFDNQFCYAIREDFFDKAVIDKVKDFDIIEADLVKEVEAEKIRLQKEADEEDKRLAKE